MTELTGPRRPARAAAICRNALLGRSRSRRRDGAALGVAAAAAAGWRNGLPRWLRRAEPERPAGPRTGHAKRALPDAWRQEHRPSHCRGVRTNAAGENEARVALGQKLRRSHRVVRQALDQA